MRDQLFRQKQSARMGVIGRRNRVGFALLVVLSFSQGAAQYETCNGNLESLADGFCDSVNNNVACTYDEGDCCNCTCTNGLEFACGSNGFTCIDPDCVDPAIAAEFPDCDGNLNFFGDGFCDSANNNLSCGYDGGDCCICTCINCSFTMFDCLDPSAGDGLYECEATPLPPPPCLPDVQRTWVIEDSAQASTLAEAVNCSGGAFDVEWKGIVTLETTIYIVDGTMLNISGVDSSATINGSGEARIFTVVNATLHLSDLSVSSGSALVGGAIAALASTLTLNRTSFFRNTAIGIGGALYVTDDSNILFGGETSAFTNNSAEGDGGALYVSGDSIVSFCTETAFFSDNKAGDDGGAFAVRNASLVSWSLNTLFSNNTSGSGGGALDLYGDAKVSWVGTTIFSNNIAGIWGGAVMIRENSIASWSGETSFYENNASHGGGLYVSSSSSIHLNGTAAFTANHAKRGGALYIVESSSVISLGRITFVANSAVSESYSRGGAMLVLSYSNITFHGETTFDGNIARGDAFASGGALFIQESSVSWGGETVFSSNEADDFGGAIFGDRSVIWWEGATGFWHNYANKEAGGALYLGDSLVWWRGNTIFKSNQADAGGGAIWTSNSNVSWNGHTEFTANQANHSASSGGALAASSSNLSWNGNASFTANTAELLAGGVLAWNRSDLTWSGPTTFNENYCNGIGGGLVVSLNSRADWSGDTTFFANVAQYAGGVHLSQSSTVSWNRDTNFTANYALQGGALVVDKSNLSWSGPTTFRTNSCDGLGGALLIDNSSVVAWSGSTAFLFNGALFGGGIYVGSSSAVSWTGQTEFTHNNADVDGGALASSVSSLTSDGASSTIVIAQTTLFVNNTCRANGGALALTGRLVIEIRATTVIFSRNFAQVSGGAIFLSDAEIGFTFHNLRFVSNSAQLGGAVYATSSGNSKIGIAGEESWNPTIFQECVFLNNEADATGGAIHTAAGQDVIQNTLFMGNKAGVGGALRLGGSASLYNCSFVENVSDEGGGAAVSNIGYISSITNNSFVDNAYDCVPGTFLDYNSSGYIFKVVCDGCDTPCEGCNFADRSKVPLCTEAIDHTTSPGGLITLKTISIDRGYWRTDQTSWEILPCYNPDACGGGVTGASDYCHEGYEGPYCAICSDGYTANLGFACDKCSNNAGGIVLALVFVVAAVIVVVNVARYLISCEREGGRQGLVERLMRYVPLQSLKIVIVSWQIMTQFASVANVIYPSVYQRFLDGIDVLNFDLGLILSVGCVVDLDFHDRLILTTIGPIVCVILLAVTYTVAVRRNHGSDQALQDVRYKHVSVILILTFLIYSSVSSILFQAFACDPLDNGKNYLRADYRIECDSSRHKGLQIYAGFMIALYSLGIPAMYTGLLFKDRRVLRMDDDQRRNDARVRSTSRLWEPYKPSVFYFEVIECGRRILLTGVAVFIFPNSTTQIAVTLILAFTFVLVQEGLDPFASRWDTWISRMGQVLVFLSMYLALLLKVDVSAEGAKSQEVFEGILVLANLSMVVAVVTEAIASVCLLREQVVPDPAPRSRCCALMYCKRKDSGVLDFAKYIRSMGKP